MRLYPLAALLVSCSFHDGALPMGNGGGDGGGPTPDGTSGPDACTMHVVPPSTNVDAMQWSAAFLTAPTWTCDQAGTTTIDATAGTATSTSCTLGTVQITNNVAQTTGGGTVLVVRLRGLTVSNGHVLRLIGNKPVVLLVEGNVVVDGGGLIDAGAKGVTPGAGGSIACDVTNGLGGPPSGGGWGAGGGGHGTAGGVGCYNIDNGGAVSGSAMLTPLRGGCSGGVGGGPAGGAGGGAFEISASGTISIGATSAANLSAAGGGAPGGNGGGNGGGAGGAILLVAPTVPTLGTSGALRAHGGAGSEGCSSCTALDSGGDGHATDNSRAVDASGMAGGGNGNDHGRRGGLASLVGNGSLSTADGEMTSPQTGGRGGGGGGGGRVVLTTGTTTASCD